MAPLDPRVTAFEQHVDAASSRASQMPLLDVLTTIVRRSAQPDLTTADLQSIVVDECPALAAAAPFETAGRISSMAALTVRLSAFTALVEVRRQLDSSASVPAADVDDMQARLGRLAPMRRRHGLRQRLSMPAGVDLRDVQPTWRQDLPWVSLELNRAVPHLTGQLTAVRDRFVAVAHGIESPGRGPAAVWMADIHGFMQLPAADGWRHIGEHHWITFVCENEAEHLLPDGSRRICQLPDGVNVDELLSLLHQTLPQGGPASQPDDLMDSVPAAVAALTPRSPSAVPTSSPTSTVALR